MMEKRCYYINDRFCTAACQLFTLKDEEIEARYLSTIYGTAFPGFSQESKGANARELDRKNCEKHAQPMTPPDNGEGSCL